MSTVQPADNYDTDSSGTNVDQMRRANKRAINMLMKKMKNQKQSVWVPQGRTMAQGRIFHKNFSSARDNLSIRS
jgi:hypothetical protein